MGNIARKLCSLPSRNSPDRRAALQSWCAESDIPVISYSQFMEWRTDGKSTALGTGGFGSCYKLEISDRILVVKSFSDVTEAAQIYHLKVEAMMLRVCQGQGTQKLVGVCVEELTLLTEYAGPSLEQWLLHDSLSEHDRLQVLHQVMATTRRCLKRNVCHNDLSIRNICVERKRQGQLRVTTIDFGVARYLGNEVYAPARPEKNVPDWVAPELFRAHTCTWQSEVYSLGQLARALAPRGSFWIGGLRKWVDLACHKDVNKRPLLEEGLHCTRQLTRLMTPSLPASYTVSSSDRSGQNLVNREERHEEGKKKKKHGEARNPKRKRELEESQDAERNSKRQRGETPKEEIKRNRHNGGRRSRWRRR